MAGHQNTPAVSQLIRMKDKVEDLSAGQTKSREDWKKQKELEEARKAGTAPAAVDESGKDINPHIPQYISSAPWYYNAEGPTLRHQRVQDESKKVYATLDDWYKRGVDTTKVATKYRKGACENCGAITHKKKDCLERPRKVGAKFSGEAIAPDEHVQPKFDLDFDGKRDRWNGYDPIEYLAIVDEFQKVEDAKRVLKTEKLKSGVEGTLPDNMVLDEDDGLEEDEDKYVDDIDMPGTKMDSKERITVRNLRIREDTAKYLRNLDPNSAYYDPKTRSMRDNPYKGTGKQMEELDFAGENFVRISGDTTRHAQAQLFAWEAQEKGVDVHLLAEPTKLEVLKKEFEKKKDEFKGSLTKNIIDKYGGEEHLEAPPKSLLMAQTEDYVEYSRQGKVIKGGEKPVNRSKYEEDIYPNNHCSVFGSFWRAGAWGYQCCHSLIQNSYCTGESGRDANDKSSVPESCLDFNVDFCGGNKEPKTLVEIHQELRRKAANPQERGDDYKSSDDEASTSEMSKTQKKNAKRRERKKQKALERAKNKKRKQKKKNKDSESDSSSSSSSSNSDSDSEDSSSEDEGKKKKRELAEAIEAEERRLKEADAMMDDRKRSYNSRYDVKAPTEAELEAYLLKRTREEDPMLEFMGKKKKK